MTSAGEATCGRTPRRRTRDRSVVERHLQAPDVGLSGGDARFHLIAGQITAGSVVARVTALGFLCDGAFLVELPFGAEAGVHRVAFAKATKRVLVRLHALGLEIGAAGAAHLGALVPIESHPAEGPQDDLGVLLGGALRVGVLDAQDEGAAGLHGRRPSCRWRCGRRRCAACRWEKARSGRARVLRCQSWPFPFSPMLPGCLVCVGRNASSSPAFARSDAFSLHAFRCGSDRLAFRVTAMPNTTESIDKAAVVASHTAPIPIQNAWGYMQMSSES